ALDNLALEERKTAWERCSVSLNSYRQANELPDFTAACTEYGTVHSQVLHDVLRRLEATSAELLPPPSRRRTAWASARQRPHPLAQLPPSQMRPPRATLDGGILARARIGRIPLTLHRPIEGTPKIVTIRGAVDGWYAAISCADVPGHPQPATGQETGIDIGLASFATLTNGQRIFPPSYYRKAEAYLRRCAGGSRGATKGAIAVPKRLCSWRKLINTSPTSGTTSITGKRRS